MTDNLNDAIEAARAVSAQYPDAVAVVCETRLSVKARKSFFGFSFRPAGHADAVVGRVFTNDDRSVSTVLALA